MDTEKHLEIQQKIVHGESPNDEGPYYHHAWWESYKGGVKGKLGGLVIGGFIGGIAGLIAGAALALTPLGLAALPLTALAFAGGGMMYGMHEFGDIGKVTGAVSAAQRQAEVRMKTFEEGKFAELQHDINEVKSLVKGQPVNDAESAAIRKALRNYDESDYRKTHYAKLNPPKMNTFAFWKVALMGLAVGALAGALLASGGAGSIIAPLLEHALGHAAFESLGAGGIMTLSVAAFGAMGASFGISRDIFRKIFDKTDLWFKGIIHPREHALVREHQIAAGEKITNGHSKKEVEVTTAVLPENYGNIDYPTSNTFHRDRLAAAADKALLSFDHTRATPQ
jgi:hypothetical protein